MSVFRQPINYMNLENELEESVRADIKYRLENDAKLRAIEQSVPTYEHFRQMVSGAHLKPLEPKDTNKTTKVSWNLLMGINENKNCHASLIEDSLFRTKNKTQSTYVLSKCVQKFYDQWNTIDTTEDKIKFLLHARDLLPEIFQVEIPADILGEFLNVCLQALMIMDDQCSSLIHVIHILTSLTTCNRFQLAITFMTIHNKLVCHQLFERIALQIQDKAIELFTVVELGKKFEVIL